MEESRVLEKLFCFYSHQFSVCSSVCVFSSRWALGLCPGVEQAVSVVCAFAVSAGDTAVNGSVRISCGQRSHLSCLKQKGFSAGK